MNTTTDSTLSANNENDNPPSEGLERGLSNRHLQMIAIGGAIGTGLFMGSGKTLSLAGPSVLLIYAILGFFLFFVMRAMGEMLLSNLKYKSFRDLAEDIIGPWAGFVVGWTYWLCWIVIGMADLSALTSYVQFWFPECPLFLPALLLLVFLLGLNLVAVRFFGEIEFWFALIKIVAIISLVVVAIVLVVIGFTSPASDAYPQGAQASLVNILNLDHGGLFPNGFTGFLAGFQIAFFAFVGIELVGTAAAEAKDPTKTLPKAINAIPIRVVLFYICALAAVLAVTPYAAINKNISPFVNMFMLCGITFAAALVNFVVLTSVSSSMNSGVYSTSRMLYGLGLDKAAPKMFARLSKSKVPANALIFSVCCIVPGIALLYAAEGSAESGSSGIMVAFTWATSLANVLFIVVWALIMVSYLLYRKRTPELHEVNVYKMPAGIFMSYAVLVFLVLMLVILCLDFDTLMGLAVSPIWFIGLAIAFVIKNKRKIAQS